MRRSLPTNLFIDVLVAFGAGDEPEPEPFADAADDGAGGPPRYAAR